MKQPKKSVKNRDRNHSLIEKGVAEVAELKPVRSAKIRASAKSGKSRSAKSDKFKRTQPTHLDGNGVNLDKAPLIVKVGSGLLTRPQGGVDTSFIAEIVRQIATLRRQGIPVILVSSGAISSGMTVLGLDKRPKDIPNIQACATIGQPHLMQAYSRALAKYGMCSAQILLTSWDLDSRRLYANAQETLRRLLELGNCLPIVNENDAITFEEIQMLNTFGDNDRLSSHMALLANAFKLVILSSIDGLYTRPDGTGILVQHVHEIDEKIASYAGQTQSERSVGGMISKLEAAKLMLKNHIPMIIANGRVPNVLIRLMKGESIGTLFMNISTTTDVVSLSTP